MKKITCLAATAALAAGAWSATPAQAETVNLTWFMWSATEEEVAAWEHVAGLVTEKHPDITVEFQTASWPNYWTKLPALAVSNDLPDIISLQSMRAPGFAQLMEPLNPKIERDGFDIESFDESIIAGLSKDGNLYALPYDFGPWIVYYNKDLFEERGAALPGPDWTMSEFMDAARAISVDNTYAIGATVVDGFLPFALSSGATYLNDAGELDLTNDGLVAAFEDYVKLVTEEEVAPLFPPGGTSSSAQASGRFTAGEIAMYLTGPWSMINLKGNVEFDLGVAPIPAGEAGSITLSAGSGFGISTTTEHKEEAWKAIQVLTGPEAEQYLAQAGRAFPARKAFQDDWYNVASEGVLNAKDSITAALENAQPFRTTENWNTVSSLFEQYAPLAFSGSQSPAEVLETIQQLSSQ